MNIKDSTVVSIPQGRILPQVTIGLEHYFSNSIIPQLFVDTELLLIDFTPPMEDIFFVDQEDIGKGIYELKEKIGHRSLIENIRGVLYTERNMEKHIRTARGRFKMNIQPCFTEKEEMMNGVIITFFEVKEG